MFDGGFETGLGYPVDAFLWLRTKLGGEELPEVHFLLLPLFNLRLGFLPLLDDGRKVDRGLAGRGRGDFCHCRKNQVPSPART